MSKVRIGMVGSNTAIGDALTLAIKRMKDIPSRSKVLILVTDGSSNAGKVEPLEAAQAAASFGVKIYTIAVGQGGVAPFVVEGFFGKSLENRPVEMDEETLQKIAALTHGKFYQAAHTKQWQEIFSAIDKLEKTPQQKPEFRSKREFFPWLIVAAMLFLAAEALYLMSPRRRLPL